MASPRSLASARLALILRPHSTWPEPRVAFLRNRLRTVLARFGASPPPSPSPTAPALPRAAATATAAGAAPPPCQLLGCNGDWAAAAEVTPGRGSGAGPAPERTAESRSSGGGSRRGRGGRLCASPSFPVARRIPGAGARRAPGASPERGGQAGQPWGRSGRRPCTLRQAPRDAPWEPRAEATLSGELRGDLAESADASSASDVSVRGPRSPRWPERRGGAPWHCLTSPWGPSLGPETFPGGSS